MGAQQSRAPECHHLADLILHILGRASHPLGKHDLLILTDTIRLVSTGNNDIQ
jgi:hypothetical protein